MASSHERGRGRHAEHGDCRIDVYLHGVSAEDVDDVVERIADVLVEAGLGADDDDAPIRSLVGVKPYVFPDFTDEQVAGELIEEYSEWVIPGGGDDDEDG